MWRRGWGGGGGGGGRAEERESWFEAAVPQWHQLLTCSHVGQSVRT